VGAVARGGISQRAFAKGAGCTLRAVQKAIAAGHLDGAIGRDEKDHAVITDPLLAVKLWAKRRSQPSQAKGQSAEVPVERRDQVKPDDRADSEWSLAEAQIRVHLANARLKEQQHEVRTGELIEKSRAIREADQAARVIRDSLLNVPDRIASELAGEEDAGVIHARLDEEIRQALQMAVRSALDGEGHDAA
jgi:hypothetical protein